MEWMFSIFSMGVLVYTFIILKDYTKKARQFESQLLDMNAEINEIKTKIQTCEEERRLMQIRREEVKLALKEYQRIANRRLEEINDLKKDMARRGKFRL